MRSEGEGWQIRRCCEAQHSSGVFVSSEVSCFSLQLHPPSSKRAGGDHDKDHMCLADDPHC